MKTGEISILNELNVFIVCFQVARLSLALSAMTGEKVASPAVGQSVLVFYEFYGEGEGGGHSEGREGDCPLY